jgi:hypothetical protein
MENPTTTASPPAARTLHEILADARRANCGQCWQVPGLRCVTHPETGRGGYHVARLSRAFRRGLISGPDLVAALAVPDAFTNATVIYTDSAS